MREETIRLARELLVWHDWIRTKRKNGVVALTDLALYKKLCERAGVPDLYRPVGIFLGELATWCKEKGLPPLNSLAVNAETHIPGVGYDSADGCSYNTWWNDVVACIESDYPPRIP
jgi:hypothetical protein